MNIGYNLDRRTLKGLPFENIQLYVDMANLGILWRANKDGLDPDYDGTLPPVKTFTFGLRTNF